jgi:hypothetical protein
MLRAVLVGAIEGAAYVALVKEVIDKAEALKNALNLIYLNFVCFWFFSMISSGLSDILTQSEQEWQIVVERRARIRRSTQRVFGFAGQNAQLITIALYKYITKDLFTGVLNALVGAFVLYTASKIFTLAYAFIQNHLPF